MKQPRKYQVGAPMQRGITLLEASAGTGKTYQITNLVLRLVAEQDVRMGELLVVTFTRAATDELLDRIRMRLAAARRLLGKALRNGNAARLSGPGSDPSVGDGPNDGLDDAMRNLLEAATAGPAPEKRLSLFHDRLLTAQEEFDQALISTIHGFCQRMLQQNAFESMVDFGLELVEDNGELLEEIVDDFYSACINTADPERYRFMTSTCGFNRDLLIQLAQKAMRNPRMPVLPDLHAPAATTDGGPGGFAGWWKDQGMEELANAFEEAYQAGDIIPAMSKGRRAKSQNKYRKKKALLEGAKLLRWVCDTSGCDDTAPCPNVDYWSEAALKKYSPRGRVFYHPHLSRVRRALAPHLEQVAMERARFVDYVRREFQRRSTERRTMSFHDLLRLLAERLESPKAREPLRHAISSRFKAALIDEFQDTDPEQWTIFRTLFGAGSHFLYLIGDPKQAIYGFRGANVNVYLQARKQARGNVFSMNTNYRSDGSLLRALNPILAAPWQPGVSPGPAGAAAGMFALEGIAYESVEPNPLRDPPLGLLWDHERGPAPHGLLSPLQIRFIDASSSGAPSMAGAHGKALGSGQVQAMLPAIVTADIIRLLDQGLRFHDSANDHWRALEPGDIAVLVRKGRQARALQSSLLRAGVPSVLSGADSVLSTDEARDLQLWLEAVGSPGSDRAARAAVTTAMFGRNAADLLRLEDPDLPPEDREWWDDWTRQLADWRNTMERFGVMRAFRAAMNEHHVQERLLAWPDGERRLTNLLHLLELLHAASLREDLGTRGLIGWLVSQRQRAGLDAETAELRLERDDSAVRLLTMHKAKGLQFPVVFAPYLWDGTLLFHSDQEAPIVSAARGSTTRVLDVHVDNAVEPKRSHLELLREEALQENMRLLYVALTRAQQRCVIYTGHMERLETSSLGLLLHAMEPGTPVAEVHDRIQSAFQRIPHLGPAQLLRDLQLLSEMAGQEEGVGPRVFVSTCQPPSSEPRSRQESSGPLRGPSRLSPAASFPTAPMWRGSNPDAIDPATLQARVFRRVNPDGSHKDLDRTWSRSSYSSMARSRRNRPTRATTGDPWGGPLDPLPQQQALGKDHDQDADIQLPGPSGLEPAVEARLRAALPRGKIADQQVPLAAYPAGALAGSYMHDLLEHMDFTIFSGTDPGDDANQAHQEEIQRLTDQRAPIHGMDSVHITRTLSQALPGMLRTPLGGELGDTCLADIPDGRRLNELTFDLPLAGGDRYRQRDAHGRILWNEPVSGADFGEAFLLGAGDGLLRRSYLESLARGWKHQRFAGYLTGSVDLIFATPLDTQHPPRRFYLADYKTNSLDLLREKNMRRGCFCPAWMLHEMEHHDYIVQYHLYTLALHRFLQQRLPDYDYDKHVGGAYYLFVRGMCGPQRPPGSPHPYGVFFHRPSRAVIERLDELFNAPGPEGSEP